MATVRKRTEDSWNAEVLGALKLEAAAAMAQYECDQRWVHENKALLLERYPEQWVAILHGRVVAHGTDVFALAREVLDGHPDESAMAVHAFVTASEPRRMP